MYRRLESHLLGVSTQQPPSSTVRGSETNTVTAGEPSVTTASGLPRESEREGYVRERGEEEEWSPPRSDKPYRILPCDGSTGHCGLIPVCIRSNALCANYCILTECTEYQSDRRSTSEEAGLLTASPVQSVRLV